MPNGTNKRNLIAAVVVLIIAGYRLLSPYVDETRGMREKIVTLKKDIAEVKATAAQYGPGWEKSITEKEQKAALLLPDSLNSSAVLDYFLTGYEQQNPGRVWFLSVNYQNGGNSSFSSGKGKDQVAARSARYKIRAQMDQARVVPYIDYMEKYSGLFRAMEFSFSVPKEKPAAGLEMDANLEFFLAPPEWARKDGIAAGDDKSRDTASKDMQSWQQIFISHSIEGLGAGKARAAAGGEGAPVLGPGKLPSIDKIVGNSIVVGETLYEEGDSVHGWKIISVDPDRRRVTLKTGGSTRKVTVR